MGLAKMLIRSRPSPSLWGGCLRLTRSNGLRRGLHGRKEKWVWLLRNSGPEVDGPTQHYDSRTIWGWIRECNRHGLGSKKAVKRGSHKGSKSESNCDWCSSWHPRKPPRNSICQPSELPRIPHTLELQDICQVGAKRPGQNHAGHRDVLLLLVAQSWWLLW